MSFEKHVQEARRLVILWLLTKAQGYEANSSSLLAALAGEAHHPTRDQLHTDLAWLAEQGLVSTRHIRSTMVATITARGADVARGIARVPGIKIPEPGEFE